VKIPPRPNIIVAPYCGSRRIPRITSTPPGFAMGETVAPSIRAPPAFSSTAAIIAFQAFLTPEGSTPSATPPTSDLWEMSGERILRATGRAKRPAYRAASAAFLAGAAVTAGMRYERRTRTAAGAGMSRSLGPSSSCPPCAWASSGFTASWAKNWARARTPRSGVG